MQAFMQQQNTSKRGLPQEGGSRKKGRGQEGPSDDSLVKPGGRCVRACMRARSLERNSGEAGWLEGMEQRGGLGLRLTTHWLLRPAHSGAEACA
eukprot:66987-Pelagomonas_calceolata.AAC.1